MSTVLGLPDAAARPVILVTTVDIGGGKSDKIEFRQGDDVEAVAREFIERHRLPPGIMSPLANHILENLSQNDLFIAQGNEDYDNNRRLSRSASFASLPTLEQDLSPSTAGLLNEQAALLSYEERQQQGQGEPTSPHGEHSRGTPTAAACSHDQALNEADGLEPLSPSSARRREEAVFSRLYALALEHRYRQSQRKKLHDDEEVAQLQASRSNISIVSSEMMRGRTAGPFHNYGEMLYAQGLNDAAKKKEKAERYKAECLAREVQGATFHPEIHNFSKSKWTQHDYSQPVWQRLSTNAKKNTAERIESLRKDKEDKEVDQCTFKPVIDSKSDKIVKELKERVNALDITAHEQLFLDAVRRQQKLREYEHWYPEDVTFHPKTNNSQTALEYLRHSWDHHGRNSESSRKPADPTAKPSIVQRLYASYEKSKAKKAQVEAKYCGNFDPDTGRALYKPETGRAPAKGRNKEGRSVGEYLYKVALEMEAKKEARKKAQEQQRAQDANSYKPTGRSEKLFQRLQVKRFTQVFQYLDEGQAGQLDLQWLLFSGSPKMDSLDSEVRADVELAAQIWMKRNPHRLADASTSMSSSLGEGPSDWHSGSGGQVAVEEFVGLMEEALLLRKAPRRYLAPVAGSKGEESTSFQPAINKKSKEMAAKLRPADQPAYLVLHQAAQNMKTKMDEMRKALQEDAMKDCTFQPQLIAETKGVQGRALRMSRSVSHSSTTSRSCSATHSAGAVLKDNSEATSALSCASGFGRSASSKPYPPAPSCLPQGPSSLEQLALDELDDDDFDGAAYLETRSFSSSVKGGAKAGAAPPQPTYLDGTSLEGLLALGGEVNVSEEQLLNMLCESLENGDESSLKSLMQVYAGA